MLGWGRSVSSPAKKFPGSMSHDLSVDHSAMEPGALVKGSGFVASPRKVPRPSPHACWLPSVSKCSWSVVRS